MPLTKNSGIPIFQFNNLSGIPWINHGISTREFGNLTWLVGDDDKTTVLQNRKKFFTSLNTREENVVEMEQVHGNHVAVVGKSELGDFILNTDGMVTNQSHVALFVRVADCVPILLVDPVRKVVGVVHAGWRGTTLEVGRLAVNHMEDHFGTIPKDLIVGIGPSIGPCCYEVDTPVIDQFKYAEKLFEKKRGSRANLDLWLANKVQLIETGVKDENVETANLCTYDNPDLFFSERKEKSTGRFGAVIWIK